ncbi:MAG: hypothetical protein IT270_15225 [Saprospiraceae bacterium]|nr:hypothetical protein [Saprospiraceae bacterium]
MYFPKPQSAADFEAGMSVILALFGFLAFWWAQTSPGVKRYFRNRWGEDKGQEFKVYFQRAVGVFSFGILPGVVLFAMGAFSWKNYGIDTRFTWFDAATTLFLSVLAFFMARAGAQKPDSKAMYPEIKTAVWDRNLLFRSFFWWILYLCAYELMFRGYLLFAIVKNNV